MLLRKGHHRAIHNPRNRRAGNAYVISALWRRDVIAAPEDAGLPVNRVNYLAVEHLFDAL